jgi:hypothetical protein
MKILKKSINEDSRVAFWDEQAYEIFWYKNYDKVLDDTKQQTFLPLVSRSRDKHDI